MVNIFCHIGCLFLTKIKVFYEIEKGLFIPTIFFNENRQPTHQRANCLCFISLKELPNISQIKRQSPQPFPRQIKNSIRQSRRNRW